MDHTYSKMGPVVNIGAVYGDVRSTNIGAMYSDKTRLGWGDNIYYYSRNIIGIGATSIVYDGYFEVEYRKAAVKRLESIYYKIYEDELEILRTVTHSNIIQYFAAIEWEEHRRKVYYIAMERADITLEDCINSKALRYTSTPEDTRLKYIKDAADGLSFLHAQKIIHRDIKPTNILVKFTSEGVGIAKLVDFGISKKITSAADGTNSMGKGTGDWMSPEALLAEEDDKEFRNTLSMDIFSLGLTIFYTLSEGKHPFGGAKFRAWNILRGELELKSILPYWRKGNHRHQTLVNLVIAMLARNEDGRPKIGSVLEHPLFWSAKTKLDFIIAISNSLSAKNEEIANIRAKLDEDFVTFLESHFHKEFDWRSMCSSNVGKFISNYRKNYDGKSLVKLIEFIRDKDQHHAEWPIELKHEKEFGEDGPNADETYVNYFEERVPELITFLYVFFQETKLRKLLNFYKINEHKDYGDIESGRVPYFFPLSYLE